MKTTKLMLIAIIAIFMLASCSKDDEEVVTQVSGLKYETVLYSYTMTGVATELYDTKAELEDEYMYEVLEFKTNGKLFVDAVEAGTWSQNGATVTMSQSDETLSLTSSGDYLSWKESGTLFTISFSTEIKYKKMAN